MQNPEIRILKYEKPIIYLDTCMLIEFSRYKKGCCADTYSNEIGKFYNALLAMKKTDKVLCPLGNQLVEMGISKKRKEARDFLYEFTNSELLLPYQIENKQLDFGYRAFADCKSQMVFQTSDMLVAPTLCWDDLLELYITPVYEKKKTEIEKGKKRTLAETLNDLKHNGQISEKYEEQLHEEFRGDYQALNQILGYGIDSSKEITKMDMLISICNRVGVNIVGAPFEKVLEAITIYKEFLLSTYHHNLPYKQIESVLFTHILQRPNIIIDSDVLDIKWASAYLPFIDYAVTDKSFCNLLQESGLADKYGTKVYSFNTLNDLLNELG